MKLPQLVNASPAELDELLALARPTFPPQQLQLLEAVLATFIFVMQALQNAKISIKRLSKMLFGASTESKDKVLKKHGAEAADGDGASGASTSANSTDGASGATASTDKTSTEVAPDGAPPQAKPGHGRNGAQAYRDSPVVDIELSNLKLGDTCPDCTQGKVYDSPPRTIVKVVGQAPLGATIYKLQRLRCRLCDAIFTAPLPEGVAAAPKYDHSCASMLAILRYSGGMPFYRLEGLQRNLNVPLPDATQWDIVSDDVAGPRYAYEELIRQAAQAPLLHNDDTPARVLSLMRERVKVEAAGQTPQAKAINTSGIVAVLQVQGREIKVVLFFTGHAHAGNNLERVLANRAKELDPPIQMCDGLAANIPRVFVTVLCNCLAHGRRLFVDLVENFPKECRYVIELLAKVYGNDAHCRDEGLSPEQRLVYHQAHSAALMLALKTWMSEQLDQHLVEPNSSLGEALRYMLKRWDELTLFLRKAGAPLDNNVVERGLKRAIRHRRNSLFFKTLNGAKVGDIYMSLIHTCELCGVNAFEYLKALMAHVEDVRTHPAEWMPWSYRERLTHIA